MNIQSLLFVVAIFLLSCAGEDQQKPPRDATLIKLGIDNNRISQDWLNALQRRHSQQFLDSLSQIERPLDSLEQGWVHMIESRLPIWSSYKDSLEVPFTNVQIADTVFVLLGYLGNNDGFTYQLNTVCFDLTALGRVYGPASKQGNDNLIDRLFAHEFTHLVHKQWAREHALRPQTFKDSILWECLYEGIGMYRSLNKRWFPIDDKLPQRTEDLMADLTPVFTSRLVAIHENLNPTEAEKDSLHHRLSHGPVPKKWGAMPVAIWMMQEANGDSRSLQAIISKGPDGVLDLAKKYLPKEQWSQIEESLR